MQKFTMTIVFIQSPHTSVTVQTELLTALTLFPQIFMRQNSHMSQSFNRLSFILVLFFSYHLVKISSILLYTHHISLLALATGCQTWSLQYIYLVTESTTLHWLKFWNNSIKHFRYTAYSKLTQTSLGFQTVIQTVCLKQCFYYLSLFSFYCVFSKLAKRV